MAASSSVNETFGFTSESIIAARKIIGTTTTIPVVFKGTVGDLLNNGCISTPLVECIREGSNEDFSKLLCTADIDAPCYLMDFKVTAMDNRTDYDFKIGVDAFNASLALKRELEDNPGLEEREDRSSFLDFRACVKCDVPSMTGDDIISRSSAALGDDFESHTCDPVGLIHQMDDLRRWLINATATATLETVYPTSMQDEEDNIAAPVRSLLSLVTELCQARVSKKDLDAAMIVDGGDKGILMCIRGPAAKEGAAAALRLASIVKRNCMQVLHKVQCFVSSEHISEDLADLDPALPFEFTVWLEISVAYPADFAHPGPILVVPDIGNFHYTHQLFELCKSESDGCFDISIGREEAAKILVLNPELPLAVSAECRWPVAARRRIGRMISEGVPRKEAPAEPTTDIPDAYREVIQAWMYRQVIPEDPAILKKYGICPNLDLSVDQTKTTLSSKDWRAIYHWRKNDIAPQDDTLLPRHMRCTLADMKQEHDFRLYEELCKSNNIPHKPAYLEEEEAAATPPPQPEYVEYDDEEEARIREAEQRFIFDAASDDVDEGVFDPEDYDITTDKHGVFTLFRAPVCSSSDRLTKRHDFINRAKDHIERGEEDKAIELGQELGDETVAHLIELDRQYKHIQQCAQIHSIKDLESEGASSSNDRLVKMQDLITRAKSHLEQGEEDKASELGQELGLEIMERLTELDRKERFFKLCDPVTQAASSSEDRLVAIQEHLDRGEVDKVTVDQALSDEINGLLADPDRKERFIQICAQRAAERTQASWQLRALKAVEAEARETVKSRPFGDLDALADEMSPPSPSSFDKIASPLGDLPSPTAVTYAEYADAEPFDATEVASFGLLVLDVPLHEVEPALQVPQDDADAAQAE